MSDEPSTTRTRRVKTTPEAIALLDQCDREMERVTAQARNVIAGILASHGIRGAARIVETVDGQGNRPPRLVIEVRQ